MDMKDYKWRTSPSGTEGTTTVYVDSCTGSDIFGTGVRTNPYRTLTKAFNAQITKPTTIVCRGTFSEDLTGDHSCAINGDYYGAAVFDGQDTYVLYGFGHSNMMIKNVPAITAPASRLLAGVGRAYYADYVGYANYVSGLAGSSALLAQCAAYMGVLGCTNGAANKYVVFARPRANTTYRISIAAVSGQVLNNTYYGCRIANRQKHYSQNMVFGICLFADFDMIANDAGNDTYQCCLFAADCKWYYLAGNNADSASYELQLTGTTSAERQASLLAALTAKYDELNVAEASRKFPTFTNCLFSTQTSSQLFNATDADDFTLKPGCDADRYVSALMGDSQYIGALPPALNVPIMDDSTGVSGTWDEKSVSGCITVDDDKICIDTSSVSLTGKILSKVISVNPLTTQFNGVYAQFASKFAGHRAHLGDNSIFGDDYDVGDILPQGRYLVTDAVTYGEETIPARGILVVTSDNTTFGSSVSGAKALEIVEPNVIDVVYCRCRSAIYARVSQTDALQAGATYLNDSGASITYHGRTVASGESFVCMVAGEQFSAADTTVTIAVMFDDTRVPAVGWCPAQLFGVYFVSKVNGAIQTDTDGTPLSSGNYISYHTSGLVKSTMDRRFVQFKFEVRRYAASDN